MQIEFMKTRFYSFESSEKEKKLNAYVVFIIKYATNNKIKFNNKLIWYYNLICMY